MAEDWIAGAVKNKGALRAKLNVKKGEKIPSSKLKRAAKAKGVLGKQARLAKTLQSFRK